MLNTVCQQTNRYLVSVCREEIIIDILSTKEMIKYVTLFPRERKNTVSFAFAIIQFLL